MKQKFKHTIKVATLFSLFTFMYSCGPDNPDPEPDKSLEIKINHVFGDVSTAFSLNTPVFDVISGDTFTPTTLVYHINNFELSKTSGGSVKLDEAQPYRMVDLSDAGSLSPIKLSLKDKGPFNSISFTLGVEDSAANAEGKLNSVFTSPMYWGMINGYIHYKLEGNLHSTPAKSVVLHVGGYMNPYKLSRRITVNFNEPLDLAKGDALSTLYLNMQKYFDGVNKIDMNNINLIHQPGDDALKIADNWQGMFTDGGITYR